MIHPTAIIDPKAEIGENVSIGPFTIIGAEVFIGDGTTIGPHVVIDPYVTLGQNCQVYQYAAIGAPPQSVKFKGEKTYVKIGRNCIMREFVTIHRGTGFGGGVTEIGENNFLMAYTHVAHDCRIGCHVIMANAASLGGHVQVDDWAILGGFTLVHQFCRVGAHSFCGMGSIITRDLPPYVLVGGNPTKPCGINTEGLQRRGFDEDSIAALKRAYRKLYLSGESLSEASREVRAMSGDFDALIPLADFLEREGRGILR